MTQTDPSPPLRLPSPSEVQKYLDRWRAANNEKFDVALRRLFSQMPNNSDVGEVAVKLAALNGIYATNIFAVTQVATHITSLSIDARLAGDAVDADLIEKIAAVEISGKRRRNYSFATKYCAFHRPELYAIYDSLVHEVLNRFLKQGEAFDRFGPGEHWRSDYAIWYRSITKFRDYYGLSEFSIRDVDKYLWMLAKEQQRDYAKRRVPGAVD